MNEYSLREILKRASAFWLPIILVFCIAITSCTPSAQSANSIDPELESQVLQIIRDNPEAIIESVQAYEQQQRQKLQAAQQAFLQQMKANPKSVIGSSPSTGASSEEIVLLEFSDFQCPFCAKAQDNLQEFIDRNGDRVTLVFKNLPLSRIHPQAIPAAQAAWAAQQQGKFWQYHDALFSQQERLGEDLYEAIATDLGLDIELFNRDRNSKAAMAAIEQDMQMAETLGVSGTPFFVMNGEPLSGAVELSELERVLAQVSQ